MRHLLLVLGNCLIILMLNHSKVELIVKLLNTHLGVTIEVISFTVRLTFDTNEAKRHHFALLYIYSHFLST